MKRIYTLLLSCLAVSAVSCNKDLDQPMGGCPDDAGQMSFTAEADGVGRRTSLQGFNSIWNDKDSIHVSNGALNYNFTTSLPAPSATATFNGYYLPGTKFLAVYGGVGADAVYDIDAKTVTGVTIPNVQKAVAGSYDPAAVPAIAYTEDQTFAFKNVPALLKFTVNSRGTQNVTVSGVKGNDPVLLSGTGVLSYNNGAPQLAIADGGKGAESYVELSGEFLPGETYYIAVNPTTFTDLKIELDKKVVSHFTNFQGQTLERGGVYDLGTLELTNWVLCGDRVGSSWTVADALPFEAVQNSDFYQLKGIVFDVNNAFKIVKRCGRGTDGQEINEWYSAAEVLTGAWTNLDGTSGNMTLPKAAYDLYLRKDGKAFYAVAEGTPFQSDLVLVTITARADYENLWAWNATGNWFTAWPGERYDARYVIGGETYTEWYVYRPAAEIGTTTFNCAFNTNGDENKSGNSAAVTLARRHTFTFDNNVPVELQ